MACIRITVLALLLLGTLCVPSLAHGWDPLPVTEDPLLRMPGTQPGQGIGLEQPDRCLNCHAGYDQPVEPGFNWQGSMMSQSARDPFFWAALTVAAQDSIAVLGNPNATDICLRCHMPQGWLEGRSDPTNASGMEAADFDGIHCDFCHRGYDPFHIDTHSGAREGDDWLGYWDERNAIDPPSRAAADATLEADIAQAGQLRLFSGLDWFGADGRPVEPAYSEAGGGQFYVSGEADKRAPFADATGRHGQLYSRFHKSRYFCSSCHDVSNPVLANLGHDSSLPVDPDGNLATEQLPAYAYFHVERTFSEFMLSAYGRGAGAAGLGPFAPDVFDTSRPDNLIATCQDCHMRDVVGAGADKNDAVLRPDDSVEHPKSGQPLHDLTGGNTLVPNLLASTVAESANYDPANAALLNRPGELTMDLAGGLGLNHEALRAGAQRARQQLQMAASLEGLAYDSETGRLDFRIQNQTGHKLISGYPEGRRMWINVRALDADGEVLEEINPWDAGAVTLKGLGSDYSDPYGSVLPAPDPLAAHETHRDELVFEVKMRSSITGELEETFHFVLADGRFKDNRIPPKGFAIQDADTRRARPVVDGEPAADHFSEAEYLGGFRDVSMEVAPGAARVEVRLYYQGVSREYVEFLRDEIDGRNGTLVDEFGTGAYVIAADPFFDRLRSWGETIWKLWRDNSALAGASPVEMVRASIDGAPVAEPETWQIAVQVEPSGGGTASCSPNPVPDGGDSSCTAQPEAGYSFAGWSGDCSGPTCEPTDVTGALSVTANFELDSYTLTASSSAGGSITPSGELNVAHGETRSFTLAPEPGHLTLPVEGTCTGVQQGDTFTTDPVVADCEVIANFLDDMIFEDDFE